MGKLHGGKWWFRVYLVLLLVLSSLGTYAFVKTIDDNSSAISNSTQSKPTYAQIEPFVAEYLEKQGALNEDGTLSVPRTGSEADITTVEEAIQKLLDTGRLDYLRGDKGERGETGAKGATGSDGQSGIASIISVGSGLHLSGGTLTLATCAVDQVLAVDNVGTWTCATVSAGGIVDTNTTNASSTLSLSGTTLAHTITDTEGNTVTSDALDLGAHFATDTEVTDAVSVLNISQYATSADLGSLTNRVAVLETNAQNYITDSQLTTTLNAYATRQWVTDQGYLVDSDLGGYATESWVEGKEYLVGSDLDDYATESWVNTQTFVTNSALTTMLGNYYTKNQIDDMNMVRGATRSYTVQVVTTMPTTPDPGVIYYVSGP